MLCRLGKLEALLVCADGLRTAGDTQWSRQWKIYIIARTHADTYTGLLPEVEREWSKGMDQAIAAAPKV